MTHVDVTQALYAVEAAITGRLASLELPPPRTHDRGTWPPDYARVLAWRQQQIAKFQADPTLLRDAGDWYAGADLRAAGTTAPDAWAERCCAFINHWCDTYDPRNAGKPGKSVRMPLVLFERQRDLVHFVIACMMGDATGLVEKSRDMGATWVCLSVTTWLWLFSSGIAVGWGANKMELVDVLGDPDTLLEKLRNQIRLLPDCFRPPVVDGVHLKHTVCRNPDNESVVSGQGGKSIGRGGRRRIYFVDEAAHIESPVAIESSLSENTRCRIDISSVSLPGTVYHRKRMAGTEWAPGRPVIQDAVNVFVMDWSEHPEKTQAWYASRRTYYENQGTPEVVAREIDRDYMGAAQGIIIPYAHAEAAVDAHVLLGFDDSGGWAAGLDLSDGGIDTNALVRQRGVVVKYAEEITDRDPGVVARRVMRLCRSTSPIELQYDSGGGFGGTVKSEFNRLRQDEGVDVSWLKLVPWSAAAAVQDPGAPIIRGDRSAPTNKNFFENFKAQAWWNVARAFYRTWRCVEAHRAGRLSTDEDGTLVLAPDPDRGEDEPARYAVGELISLDSRTIQRSVLTKLMRELSQATMGQSTRLKLLVNKAPDGAKSPNLADGLIMGRFRARPPSLGQGSMFGPKILYA